MKQKQKLHMIGNAHLDPVWLWQWQEGFQETKATFRSVLDRMSGYDDFVYTSSSAMYEWVENNDPPCLKRFGASRKAAGRSWAAGESSRTVTFRTGNPLSAKVCTVSDIFWRNSA